jgi:general secretion pathway protein G
MRKQKGFTLIELVVVVMILGILAAVAAPKLLNTSGTAADQGIKQTLGVVRDAIERYAAEHSGTLPTDLKADLITNGNYLRGADIPVCPVGANNNLVNVVAVAAPTADASPTKGWKYSTADGSFICNSGATTKSDPGLTYDKF